MTSFIRFLIGPTLFIGLCNASSALATAGPGVSGGGGNPVTTDLTVNVGSGIGGHWEMACDSMMPPSSTGLAFASGYTIHIVDTNGSYLPAFANEFVTSSALVQKHSCSYATDYVSADHKILYRELSNGQGGIAQRELQLFVSQSEFIGTATTTSGNTISLAGEFAQSILKTLVGQIASNVPQGNSCSITTPLVSCSADDGECTLNVSPLLASADLTPQLQCSVALPPVHN